MLGKIGSTLTVIASNILIALWEKNGFTISSIVYPTLKSPSFYLLSCLKLKISLIWVENLTSHLEEEETKMFSIDHPPTAFCQNFWNLTLDRPSMRPQKSGRWRPLTNTMREQCSAGGQHHRLLTQRQTFIPHTNPFLSVNHCIRLYQNGFFFSFLKM